MRVNSRGEIEPVLAVAWQHDPDFKRWRFSLRPKVMFHDGEPLTGASAEPSLRAALKQKYGEVSIEAGGQALVVESEHAMPELLDVLALPDAAISRKSDADPLIGTGPFRVTAWEPGRRLTLAAFDDYWGARPYLDAVQIEFGAGREHADLFDIPPGPAAAHPSRRLEHVVVFAAHSGGDHVHERRSGAGSGAGARHRPRAHRQCAGAAQGRSGVRFASAVAQRVRVPVSCHTGREPRQAAGLGSPGKDAHPELSAERSVPAIGGRARGVERPRRRDHDPAHLWREWQSAIAGMAARIHRRRS